MAVEDEEAMSKMLMMAFVFGAEGFYRENWINDIQIQL